MTATLTAPDTKTASPSLYQLTLDSQEVDGQLAIALDLAASDDPEQQAEAERLITSLLESANTNQKLLLQKANSVCAVREMLLGKAEYLRNQAADRIAKAEAEERAAQRLENYLLRCLTAMHPGQSKFELPEYLVSSRASEAVEVDESADLPPDLTRVELKVKLSGDGSNQAGAIEALIRQHLADALPSDWDLADAKVAPDKTAIKAAIKAGQTVPGAQLVKRRNWSIK